MPKDRTRRCLPLRALPLFALLAACQTTVTTPPAKCSQLIPSSWRAGIAPVPLPAFETVGEVLTAFVDQSARLSMANDRTKDTVSIVETCEKMQNDARARPRFLGLF